MARPVNTAGVELVKKYEGLCLHAYLCPAGKPTVGYGHTKGVTMDSWVSADEAEELLHEDLREAGEHVERLIAVPLNDNQYAALASFVFNFGPQRLLTSTMRRRLNAGDYGAVPDQLPLWVWSTDRKTGKKKIEQGLVKRRAAEAELWGTPP